MCGIIGYVGTIGRNPLEIVMQGLKKLEYRGYDSAGVAGISQGEIYCCKEVGKLSALEQLIERQKPTLDIAIGHTRWATHGKPNVINAHPHCDTAKTLAIIHNGIIENHDVLRQQLAKQGVKFISDTDTEVVAHLIASLYKGNILAALKSAVAQLKGAYALVIVHKDYPGEIFAIAHQSPIVIGVGDGESFVASDSHAFSKYTTDAHFLANNEIAVVKANECTIYDAHMAVQDRPSVKIMHYAASATKEGYEHFTHKEIFEQPASITRAFEGRLDEEFGTANFADLIDQIDLTAIQRVLIIGCGTSWNAGYVAAYMIEELARLPTQVEISSEYRYKNPIVQPETLTIAISQSGETADTVAAVRELKSKGAKILAICNVEGSTMTREADVALLMHAGPEIGVCSTKAFTSQLTILALLALQLARARHMDKSKGREFISALKKLPGQVQQILDQEAHIRDTAIEYAYFDNYFYLGRSYLYPASLEGALKLKEISYINANGYPAGEMKHGPIALINEACPTVALCANRMTFEKLLSNLMEVKARSGPVIAIAMSDQNVDSVADAKIIIPETLDPLAAILTTVAMQLFEYHDALKRGDEIVQPRNLAKTVTVE